MKNVWVASLTIAAIASLALPTLAIGQEQIVKIGIAVPLTGPIAHLGKDIESGARLAFDKVNAQPPVINGKTTKFQLVIEDDQSEPRIASQVAQRLVDRKVLAVIGHYNSGTTIPASRIYAKAGIPQITPGSTNPLYTQQGFKTAFRIIANDDQQGWVLGNFAYDTLKARKVAVIDDRTAAGQGQADRFIRFFEEKGGKVITRQFTTSSSVDFTAVLTAIKNTPHDLIFFGGMDAQAGPMASQMKKLGINSKLLGADGMQSSVFTRLAGKAAEGHIASSVGMPKEKMIGFSKFKQEFNGKYGELQAYAPYSYDAALVLVDAMKRANSTDPAKVSAELHKTNYKGLTGNIQFDKKGDIKDGVITLYQVKNGLWASIDAVNNWRD